MAVLRIDHPDIIQFIEYKNNLDKITNFNISVGVTESFMKAFADDTDYELINPRTNEVVEKLKAKTVFDKIVISAWKTGEPGIIFLDRMNEDNPTPHVGEIESTNPCGEQPLLPYESCNLGSINLSKFYKDGKVDYDRLGETVDDAVHFLDNVIDANKYPLEKIRDMTRSNRKIGLGIMGFADLLFMLKIPYNSEDAVKVAEDIMSFIQKRGRQKSQELAQERGTFENYKGSIFYPNTEIRNATITTIAPTGTISIISNCSSGIEPLFALAYVRNVMDGTKMLEVHPYFEKVLKERGIYSESIMKKIIEAGSVEGINEIPDDLKKIFVVSHDISPSWHIRIQSAFQKYTDNAVSKTVNFPKDATQKDVEEVFRLAYKLKCKGVTIYRDGSRNEQVLSIGNKKEEKESQSNFIPRRSSKRIRPDAIIGSTFKVKTGCGSLYVTVNEDQYGVCEVFSHLGKTGGCASSQAEAVSRMVSLALRSGVEPKYVIEQLQGIQCPNSMWFNGHKILSCPDGIAWALKWYIEQKNSKEPDLFDIPKIKTEKNGSNGTIVGSCPDCGATLVNSEGCLTCHSCGYSKCL